LSFLSKMLQFIERKSKRSIQCKHIGIPTFSECCFFFWVNDCI
jgi:hypothetical protein